MVRVKVEDVNDNRPRWLPVKAARGVSIETGPSNEFVVVNLKQIWRQNLRRVVKNSKTIKPNKPLLCLKATDDDVSRKFYQICKYASHNAYAPYIQVDSYGR